MVIDTFHADTECQAKLKGSSFPSSLQRDKVGASRGGPAKPLDYGLLAVASAHIEP